MPVLPALWTALLACSGGYATIETCVDCEDSASAPLTGEIYLELSINEVMAKNGESWVEEDDSRPDWIEIYNGSEAEVDLDGFLLRDNLEDEEASLIDGTLIVPPGEFVLLLADGEGTKGPEYLDMKLSADGEELGLFTPDDQALDLMEFGLQLEDMALAREEDGEEDSWIYVPMGTPGSSNDD